MSDARWDVIDKIPDDMDIYGSDHTEAPLKFDVWRAALGHPRAEGGSHCMTCEVNPCFLMSFYDSVITSVIRELDKAGLLVPKEETT